MNEPDLEIGDDPMLCHLCGKDIPGSAIVGHITVEHGGGVSAVSPDARKLAEDTLSALATEDPSARWSTKENEYHLARALLSALDALEQAAGGGGKAESGGTAVAVPSRQTRWNTQTLVGGGDVPADQRGDCTRACITSLLGLPITAIENCHEEHWWSLLRGECYRYGYDLALIDTRCEPPLDAYWIATLPSLNLGPDADGKPSKHCVVARGYTLIHDPARGTKYNDAAWAKAWEQGTVSEGWVLVPLDPARSTQDPAKPEPPKVSDPPGSVEALEAERAYFSREADRMFAQKVAAEVGRDQANKERDEARKALREYGHHKPDCRALFGSFEKRNACTCGLDAALAGVPGGGHGSEQDNLGGGAAACSKGEEA